MVYQLPNADVRDIGLDVCIPEHTEVQPESGCSDVDRGHTTPSFTITSDHVGISIRMSGYTGIKGIDQGVMGSINYLLGGQSYPFMHPCVGAQVQVMSSVDSESTIEVTGYHRNTATSSYMTKVGTVESDCSTKECVVDAIAQAHVEDHSDDDNPDNYIYFYYTTVTYGDPDDRQTETFGVTIEGTGNKNVVAIAPPRIEGLIQTERRGSDTIHIDWQNADGALLYDVQSRVLDGTWGRHTNTLRDSHFTFEYLQCGTYYEFQVRAKSGGDEWYDVWGPLSQVYTVRTGDC